MHFSTPIFTIAIAISACGISAQFDGSVGDACTKEGNDGTCKFISDCEPAIVDVKNGIYPQICGFKGSKSIVCCVEPTTVTELPSRSSPVGERSLKKCKEYAKYAFRVEEAPTLSVITKYIKTLVCPIDYEKLIVGGTDAKKSEFPHMAQVGFLINGKIAYSCGGSIISENFILTAGHCLKHRTAGDPIQVRVGITKQTDLSLSQVRNVIEVIKHPDYEGLKYNDIGLLKVDPGFDFNTAVRPACLFTKKDFPFENAIASGWGKVGFTAKGSNNLLKVVLRFFNHNDCNKAYANANLPNGIIDDMMVCAGNDHKDTCQGDSGGPLQIYHETTNETKCMYDLVGVTSFGKACGLANSPGVYTRVSNYIQWIEDLVWKD